MTGNYATPTGTVHGTRLGKGSVLWGTERYDCGIGPRHDGADKPTSKPVICKRCLAARKGAGRGRDELKS